jgi:hypothetical protein
LPEPAPKNCLLDVILSLIDEHAAGEQEDELQPILLSVS